jgi:hypothetical protein
LLDLQEYIDHIQEIVSWMGWTHWQITYASHTLSCDMSFDTTCWLPFSNAHLQEYIDHIQEIVLDGLGASWQSHQPPVVI